MRAKEISYLISLLFLFSVVASAGPDEASGKVISIIDGKTFEVRIEKTDPRVKESVERVTLADLKVLETWLEGSVDESIEDLDNASIDLPADESIEELDNVSIDIPVEESIDELINVSTREGPSAKDLAVAILLNKTVWLDIDDGPEDGRDDDGNLEVVLRLSGLDGGPVLSPSFNRMLVDYGMAEVDDSPANEFDPADWWPPQDEGSGENETIVADEEKKSSGLNIDIKPTKPNVDVKISPLNVKINPTRPNVNVSLTGPSINVNPTKPSINVNPNKPAVDVKPTEGGAPENEDNGGSISQGSLTVADEGAGVPMINYSEPVILRNLTVPITLVNPAGNITVINCTGHVTLIDPTEPVNVIDSTEPSPISNGDVAEMMESAIAPRGSEIETVETVETEDPETTAAADLPGEETATEYEDPESET
jgi:endonuclease YncB( thermonuclease family)